MNVRPWRVCRAGHVLVQIRGRLREPRFQPLSLPEPLSPREGPPAVPSQVPGAATPSGVEARGHTARPPVCPSAGPCAPVCLLQTAQTAGRFLPALSWFRRNAELRVDCPAQIQSHFYAWEERPAGCLWLNAVIVTARGVHTPGPLRSGSDSLLRASGCLPVT